MPNQNSTSEYVVLVDQHNRAIGTANKTHVHGAMTPLHRGFSLFLFDSKGQLLLQQRSLTKKTWPGAWSNSVCGHPNPGESNQAAAQRRLDQELGIILPTSAINIILPHYQYCYQRDGVVENEICPIMVARCDMQPHPNRDEVIATRWVNWEAFLDSLTPRSDYPEWCIEEAQLLAQAPAFRTFLSEL